MITKTACVQMCFELTVDMTRKGKTGNVDGREGIRVHCLRGSIIYIYIYVKKC